MRRDVKKNSCVPTGGCLSDEVRTRTRRRLERRATTKNNENQSVCDRFPIVYLLYWNFLPRLGKLLNTRWNFELGDGDARFWSAHGTSTNPFEEGRSTEKLRFPPQEAYGE